MSPTSRIRRDALSVALLSLFSDAHGALATVPHPTTTRLVTSCDDDGSPGTLRSVLLSANENDIIDLGQLGCSTIALQMGVLDLSDAGPHPLANLTLRGPGAAALTIDAGGTAPLLVHGRAEWDSTLKVEGLRLARGYSTGDHAACIDSSGDVVLDHAIVDDCHVESSNLSAEGGAVRAAGSILLESTLISGSSARSQGVSMGGGAFAGGDLVSRGDLIVGNKIEGGPSWLDGTSGGGGLYARRSIHLVRTTVRDNSADRLVPDDLAYGGGVMSPGDVLIEESLLQGNTAAIAGGGVARVWGPDDFDTEARTLRLVNTTVSDNYADVASGGVSAVYRLEIVDSTITANDARYSVGGAYVGGSSVEILIHNSIIQGNTAGSTENHGLDLGTREMSPLPFVEVGGAHNIIGSADSLFVLPKDTLSIDPLLAPLADNGGPTLTHALLPGSPALDAGDNLFALAVDQRGEPRVTGIAADIGAVEMALPDSIFASGFD